MEEIKDPSSKRLKGLESCECIEKFESAGIEFPMRTLLDAGMTKFYPGFVYPVKLKGKRHEVIIRFCPFCGRKLHTVTEETWAERRAIAEKARQALASAAPVIG